MTATAELKPFTQAEIEELYKRSWGAHIERYHPTSEDIARVVLGLREIPWVLVLAFENRIDLNCYVGGGDRLNDGILSHEAGYFMDHVRELLMYYIMGKDGWDEGDWRTPEDYAAWEAEVKQLVAEQKSFGLDLEVYDEPQSKEQPAILVCHARWELVPEEIGLYLSTTEYQIVPQEQEGLQKVKVYLAPELELLSGLGAAVKATPTWLSSCIWMSMISARRSSTCEIEQRNTHDRPARSGAVVLLAL